ncbi:UDP-3-O-(3-hydroxymyristoyl)glucosamine N-acyltransferase [Thiomicrorhabdus sp.]|uniref:UDP-3-O-(3-hydroxymyristoyl)glucosamine N-acyltransferase n=1 Tax=Thiomicrorhabdus sp. TaxID=2039724 RepID=UPI0029C72003|nr:UDP-3-O-(3-hydroxymyristoyl)glucosamine N-acyltransferase [Thiomicrorhabdus sp.]
MTLIELVRFLESKEIKLVFHGDSDTRIHQVAPLDKATAGSLTFLNDKKYLDSLESTQASVVILSPQFASMAKAATIAVDNPYYVYALSAQFLYPRIQTPVGVHPTAQIDESATLGDQVRIGPNVIVGAGVNLGADCDIQSGTVIAQGVRIGRGCYIGKNVVIENDCIIGDECIIKSGAVIGGEGFGWAKEGRQWHRIPQIGRVVLGNRVSIGNNSTIDRGAIEDTVLADNCIIDNLVHVGHNCYLGEASAVAALSGFAGTSKIGANCTVAGQVGFAGHLTVCDNAHFMAKSGVTSDITKPGAYSGFPVTDAREWQRNGARARHLDSMFKELKALKKELQALKNSQA